MIVFKASGVVMTRVDHGEAMAAVARQLSERPWQTIRELGGQQKLARVLHRLLRKGTVVRRKGKRKYNLYEYALAGTEGTDQ